MRWELNNKMERARIIEYTCAGCGDRYTLKCLKCNCPLWVDEDPEKGLVKCSHCGYKVIIEMEIPGWKGPGKILDITSKEEAESE